MGLRGVLNVPASPELPSVGPEGDCRETRRVLRDLNEVAPGLRLVPRVAAICN
jgi:hypothetical protein